MSFGNDLRHKEGPQNERSSLAHLSDTENAKTRGQMIALDIRKVIHHFFPDLCSRLEAVCDPRERRDYSMTEILLGGIFLFVCKEGSRNSFNNDRGKEAFLANYEALF